MKWNGKGGGVHGTGEGAMSMKWNGRGGGVREMIIGRCRLLSDASALATSDSAELYIHQILLSYIYIYIYIYIYMILYIYSLSTIQCNQFVS